MNIIPELNLNKHPKDVKPYSLVNAQNMMIHQDSALLCSDNKIVVDDFITGRLKESIGTDDYKIRYILPCNTEFILFVETDNPNRLNLIRYNEKYKYPANLRTEIEYNEGTDIQGTFTYNKGHLIIAITSPGCPLKVLDLGGEDDIPAIPTYKQPICPEVRIPTVTTSSIKAPNYKGWHHIFIRFKISSNNYTQWFNTNKSVFVDEFKDTFIEDYYIGDGHDKYSYKSENLIINGTWEAASGVNTDNKEKANFVRTTIHCPLSDSKDICQKSFKCELNDIIGYDNYQLGFIVVRKDSTKCFRTNDIKANIRQYNVNINSLFESSLNEMITSYNNYYNVTGLDTYNNLLYIANYQEINDEHELSQLIKNITLDISDAPATDLSDGTIVLNDSTTIPYNKDYQYYNFYIHFIDKYGNSTNGFQIGKFAYTFNRVDDSITDYDGKLLLHTTNPNKFRFSINKLPNGHTGFFVSYEPLENINRYKGVVVFDKENDDKGNINLKNIKSIKIVNNDFNVDDKINLNYSTIKIYNPFLPNPTITEAGIESIELLAANSVDNICQPTCIKVTIYNGFGGLNLDSVKHGQYYVAELINGHTNSDYSNKIKTLVPCSNVCYNLNEYVIANTNTGFYSYNLAILFEKAIYDETKTIFKYIVNNKIKDTYNFKNIGELIINKSFNSYEGAIVEPFEAYLFPSYKLLPTASCSINNTPDSVAFPIINIKTENPYFALGRLTLLNDTIDLLVQKNVPHYENYPKYLTNYVEDNTYESEFPKTIRRSNVISDESVNIGWRFFEPTNYKNIIENKGSIIKLSSLGHIMLVHTEHSLFQFNCDSALKTNENKQISIANNDIWDLNYQELITSEFGCAGITNPNHAVIGTFGYIFYEEDNDKIYRYDNNSVEIISSNINGYLRNKKLSNLIIIDDIKRNRLMFIYNDLNSDNMLSYNYKHNCFVSFHDNIKRKGFNTKLNTYYFSDKQIYKYSADEYNMCACAIMVNEHYPINKMLEYIKYKVNKIIDTSNLYLPQDIRDTYYSGDKLRVLTEECDTGLINLYIENPKTTINSVKDYTKPYRELGNWNYNMFRNNPTSKPIRTLVSDLSSRLYGNWYVFNFAFSDITTENKCIEVESLTCAFNKNLT